MLLGDSSTSKLGTFGLCCDEVQANRRSWSSNFCSGPTKSVPSQPLRRATAPCAAAGWSSTRAGCCRSRTRSPPWARYFVWNADASYRPASAVPLSCDGLIETRLMWASGPRLTRTTDDRWSRTVSVRVGSMHACFDATRPARLACRRGFAGSGAAAATDAKRPRVPG